MSEWVGFSDADLQRMKRASQDDGVQSRTPKIVKPVTGGRAKLGSSLGQKPQRKQNSRTAVNRPQRTPGDVPASAMLSKPPQKVEIKKKVVSPPTTPSEQIPLHGKTSPPIQEVKEKPNETKTEPVKEPEILEDVEIIQEKEKLKLEDIQKRQKEMEEKNKRKKTMLAKAIAERRKKASAESTKLLKIQAELSKLDDMLNYDVSILRDRIDTACQEYNHAQKRFEKAEAEYIAAKIMLHKSTEMKEELTEHLYKLIQLNEERKANKLEDLMQKLELEEPSEPESSEAAPPSPTSAVVNDKSETDNRSTSEACNETTTVTDKVPETESTAENLSPAQKEETAS